tara:strand:- start:4738 stop:5628 length:891 start_codon:yes stop_codon:yes gene_type:complete
MRILITGGSGFIGQHILGSISNYSHSVMVLSRNKISNWKSDNTIIGDLSDISSFEQKLINFQPEIIMHLAWQGIPDFNSSLCKKNLHDSINFFDWIFEKINCKKIIVSGSCFEYGINKGKCEESHVFKTQNFFAWAKNALQEYLSIKCIDKNIALNWFRIFYVYGPGQREKSLIPTLIKSFRNLKMPSIKTPANRNDFIYVEDVAHAFISACEKKIDSGVYNLGSGESTSIYKICKIVESQLTGSTSFSKKLNEISSKQEEINFWADNSKSIKAFSWNPKVTLKRGIQNQIISMQK